MNGYQPNIPFQLAPAGLPIDIICDSLRYLTIEPLKTIRLVNNDWSTLILSGGFGRDHRAQMVQDNHWIYYFVPEAHYRPIRTDGRHVYYRSDRLNGNQPNHINILCSCSGLVVCTTAANVMYLWNPVTNTSIIIPPQPIVLPNFIQTARVSFSMGHDTVNDDFIIVRITIFGGMVNRNEVRLFSRNYGAWIRGPDFPYAVPFLRSGVPVSGSLHWLVNMGGQGHGIATMSMNTLDYTLMNFNNHVDWPFTYTHLDRIGDDRLCVYSGITPRGGFFQLSVLADYHDQSSWTRIMIQLDEGICRFSLYANLQPLQYVDSERSRILFRVNPVGSLGIFDTITGVFNQLDEGDNGIVGEVGVVRILQTLERPTGPFV